MNEVLYAIEYLLRSLTWKDAAVFCIVLFVVCGLLKVKKDKIEEHLDEK